MASDLHNGQSVSDDVVALSLEWEAETGYDSIPTIERVYDRAPSGAYVCVWPGCSYSRHYSGSMWRHVHSAHGQNCLPPSERVAP